MKRAPFKYLKWKFASEIGHFVSLLKLTLNFLQFQNKQFRITKWLIRFLSYVTRFFYFHFFSLKFLSYEIIAMTSQLDLTRFYEVIIRNSVFQLDFLTQESQIPLKRSQISRIL